MIYVQGIFTRVDSGYIIVTLRVIGLSEFYILQGGKITKKIHRDEKVIGGRIQAELKMAAQRDRRTAMLVREGRIERWGETVYTFRARAGSTRFNWVLMEPLPQSSPEIPDGRYLTFTHSWIEGGLAVGRTLTNQEIVCGVCKNSMVVVSLRDYPGLRV